MKSSKGPPPIVEPGPAPKTYKRKRKPITLTLSDAALAYLARVEARSGVKPSRTIDRVLLVEEERERDAGRRAPKGARK